MNDLSQKQIEANRINGKRGGVKTDEGKAISRYNAIKHGLLSKEVLLEGESEDTLLDLGKRMRSELKPATEIENVLVDRIIANVWRLKRAMQVETGIFNVGLDSPSMNNDTKNAVGNAFSSEVRYDTFGKFIRYESFIERGIYKALHELQRLQAARNGEHISPPLIFDLNMSKDE